MKKKVLCAALLTAMICSFAGCGGNSASTTTTTAKATAAPAGNDVVLDADTGDKDTSVTASDIAGKILEEIPIASAFEKKKETLADYFDDLDVDDIEDFNFTICASGAYPDEIGIFRFESAEDAEEAVPVMKARLQYQKDMYKDYTPDEYYKLEDAVISQNGKWVWYLVTANNSRADEIVRSHF